MSEQGKSYRETEAEIETLKSIMEEIETSLRSDRISQEDDVAKLAAINETIGKRCGIIEAKVKTVGFLSEQIKQLKIQQEIDEREE